MFNVDRVQHYTKSGDQTVTLRRVTPYIRLRDGGDAPLFLQNGLLWEEGGPQVPDKEVPEWVWTMIGKLSAQSLEECGGTVERQQWLRKRAKGPVPNRDGEVRPIRLRRN